MKVLIIGSTGQLGQDLMEVFGQAAVGLSHQDLDVADGLGVIEAVRAHRPDLILNTAAFHRVDDCEVNPALAFQVNALGAFNVARASATVNARLVFFSTDYVFGAEEGRRLPYSEQDRPAPLNVYGVSKLAGEQLVIQANPRSLVIRSAGLYGTATSRKGWTFPELILQKVKAEGRAQVVTDQVLSPTYTQDLAQRVKELVEHDAVGVVHVVNVGECSWYMFAQAVIDYAGVSGEILPIDTVQTRRRARRPQYSALYSARITEVGLQPLRPWQDALTAYLRARGVV